MKKTLLCLFLTIAFGPFAFAQTNKTAVLAAAATTTCSAPSNAVLALPLSNTQGSATIAVTANAGGNTISWFASNDTGAASNWFSITSVQNSVSASTQYSSTTGTGSFQFSVGSYTYICAEMSTLSSGTSSVSLNSGVASARAGGGGGSGTSSNQTKYGASYNSSGTATAVDASAAAPSTNGTYNLEEIVTAGAAVAPAFTLVGLVPDQAAGASVLYSDNNNVILNPAAALALPTPTTLGNANFFSVIATPGGTASTITPATWTISLNGGTAGATAVAPANSWCSLLVDQVASTQWDLNCQPMTAAAITALIQTLTGCNTATNVYTPQANDCVAPSGGSGSGVAYGAGAGSVNVMTVTTTPAVATKAAGTIVAVLPNLANTTATPTLNVGGAGAQTITKLGTQAVTAGDYSTTAVAVFESDGSHWQLLNPQNSSLLANGLPILSSSCPTASGFMGYHASDNNELCWGNGGGNYSAVAAGSSGNGSTTCTNQVLTAVSGGAAPTCTTLASTFLPGTAFLRVAMTADWTCGTGGTVSSCTSATIVGSTGTAMTITLPSSALSWDWDCDGVVSSATGTPANNWNMITATNGATNVTASYAMGTAAAVGGYGATTDQASTTTTFSIGGTWTLGAAGTKFPFHIHARIEGASASGTVVSLQLIDPTVADLLTIYRGMSCWVHQ